MGARKRSKNSQHFACLTCRVLEDAGGQITYKEMQEKSRIGKNLPLFLKEHKKEGKINFELVEGRLTDDTIITAVEM